MHEKVHNAKKYLKQLQLYSGRFRYLETLFPRKKNKESGEIKFS